MSAVEDEMDTTRSLYTFTQESSMHGVRYLSMKTYHMGRRIAWLLLILGSVTYFCGAAYTFLHVYVTRPLSTKITLEKTESLPFPTITVCNNNLWKLSALQYATSILGTDALSEIMADLYNNQNRAPSMDKYNWSTPQYQPIMFLVENDTKSFLKDAAHQLHESVVECAIFGEEVNCTDVFITLPTDGGYCYQFNSEGTLNATYAGKTGGIRFILNTNLNEYTTGPNSESEGFSLTFHNHYEVPLTQELGVGVSPHTQASIMLQKTELRRYPPPADGGRSDCLDTEKKENPLQFYQSYSLSACISECKASYVFNSCGCVEPFQPRINNASQCLLPQMLSCSTPARLRNPTDIEAIRACDCKNPCVESEFGAKISTFKYPSENYLSKLQLSKKERSEIKKNYVAVDIFFGKMSYQLVEETLAYTIFDMIANVGGTLGLCVGASILTVCEFLEFGLVAISRALKRKKRVGSS